MTAQSTKAMLTLDEINARVIKALLKAIGPTNTIHYLRQLGRECDGCMKERGQRLDAMSGKDLTQERQVRKESKPAKRRPRSKK